MSDHQLVWVDAERCTGCATCAELCHLQALSVKDGVAYVDEETCDGCLECVDRCPEEAIHHLVHAEIVKVEDRIPLAVKSRGTLAETAGAAATVAGLSLLTQVARWLARVVGRWLAEGYATGSRGVERVGGPSSPAKDRPGVAAGHRARHRRRGS